jgi:hypothetical protein
VEVVAAVVVAAVVVAVVVVAVRVVAVVVVVAGVEAAVGMAVVVVAAVVVPAVAESTLVTAVEAVRDTTKLMALLVCTAMTQIDVNLRLVAGHQLLLSWSNWVELSVYRVR